MQPGESLRFTASYDRATKIISAAVCGGLALLGFFLRLTVLEAFTLLLAGVTYSFSPRAYTISRESISIKRLIGAAVVPLENVLEARRTPPADLTGCIRVCASGGLLGYFGLFRTARFGNCTWYVTNAKQMVVVRTAGKTVLFSPA